VESWLKKEAFRSDLTIEEIKIVKMPSRSQISAAFNKLWE